MIALVERQNLFWGRGLFLPSFPDPGIAQLAAALARACVPYRTFDGTWRWLGKLLDPEWLATRLRHDDVPRGAVKLRSLLARGETRFSATVRRAREVLEVRRPEDFFDVPLVQRAIAILEAGFALFEEDVRRDGAENHPWVQQFIEEIQAANPKLVAFAMAGHADPVTRALIRALHGNGLPTVGGGWIALGLDPPALSARCRAWGLDCLVSGPGEVVLPELHACADVSEMLRLPNVVGPDSTRVANLTPVVELPTLFDYSRLLGRPYFAPAPIFPLVSNRGCYWKRCRFCPQAHNTHPFIELDPEKVARTVSDLRDRHGARHFFFVDECISPRFARRFSEAILARGLGEVRFSAMSRPDAGFREEVLDLMGRAGFRSLLWGVESGSQRVLDLMQKGTRIPDVDGVLARAHAHGIANFAFMMIGFPGETPTESGATLEFLRRRRAVVDGAQLSSFVAYESSEIGLHPERFGLTLGDPTDASELGTRRIAAGGSDRRFLEGLRADFEAHYEKYVSGRYSSVRHQYYAAASLLALMFQHRPACRT